MSKLIASQVIHFAFNATPELNPYRATADYLKTFLQPSHVPWWAIYIEHCIGLVFILMFCQASHILYVRSKTKKFYDIGLNRLGMVQLDRANHCALCYFCYSIIAGVNIILGDLVATGHLDQAWPNFLLGIKCTITITCACVILWLCISHFALTNQGAVDSHESSPGSSRSSMAWVLNGCLVIVLLISNVPILVSFLQLTVSYNRVYDITTPVIDLLLKSASTYSIHTYRLEKLMEQILPCTQALHYIDLLVQYTHNGLMCYVVISAFICLMYIPFLFILFVSTCRRNGSGTGLRKKQKDVLVNTILELTILILFIACTCYGLGIFRGGDFIFDSRFWITIRIGTNAVIAIFGNIVLFLISRSLKKSEIVHEKEEITEMPISGITIMMGYK